MRRATGSGTQHLRRNIYFYPRSPCGERLTKVGNIRHAVKNFYPRSPCGERRVYVGDKNPFYDFYPRSPCGERRKKRLTDMFGGIFLSTLSLRRATQCVISKKFSDFNFYPRSPCGERRFDPFANYDCDCISIHALLAESDVGFLKITFLLMLFLSTLSLRRATIQKPVRINCVVNFYPRSPCGERHSPSICILVVHNFYPRSPCGERL